MLSLQALIQAARGPQLLGLDKKQWAWLLLHSFLFALLCYWDTYLTVRLKGGSP